MRWQEAEDIKSTVTHLIDCLGFTHIDRERIVCFRSFGSSSRARARIWGFPRVWQQALNLSPHYIIEVLSEKFDRLKRDDQIRVLIHELVHIPKTFSGALVAHKGRRHRIDDQVVERLFKEYKKSNKKDS